MDIIHLLFSCLHLYDDVVDGLAGVFIGYLLQYGYLGDKPCIFSLCHDLNLFMITVSPSLVWMCYSTSFTFGITWMFPP